MGHNKLYEGFKMIKELNQSTKNMLVFEITGEVTLAEEKAWIKRFDALLETYDKVNVAVILGKNSAWESRAGWEDIKWLMGHVRRFDKIAIVAEGNVWKWLITVDSFFAKMMEINERYFEPTETKEAIAWIKDEK